jgi:hypothetical protein
MRAYQFRTGLHNKLSERFNSQLFNECPSKYRFRGVGSFSQGRQQPGAEIKVITAAINYPLGKFVL